MSSEPLFRSARLTGRQPGEGVEPLFISLFGDDGPRKLLSHREAWSAGRLAPWVLAHADHDVGVGGFSVWQDAEALELSFHFLEEVWGQGLASEFVQAALDAASFGLRQTRFVACVDDTNLPSVRILEKAGFLPSTTPGVMELTLRPLRVASPGQEEP